MKNNTATENVREQSSVGLYRACSLNLILTWVLSEQHYRQAIYFCSLIARKWSLESQNDRQWGMCLPTNYTIRLYRSDECTHAPVCVSAVVSHLMLSNMLFSRRLLCCCLDLRSWRLISYEVWSSSNQRFSSGERHTSAPFLTTHRVRMHADCSYHTLTR